LGIVAYYAVAALLVTVVWRFSPAARELLNRTLLRNLSSAEGGPLSRTTAADIVSSGGAAIAVLQGRSTLLVLAGALLVVLPVAWVYSLTRRRRGFEQSLVHILVLLPVAVAGMVVLIQNSVALAFSLAGIVAVLRFRNTIEDVKDGVYVFIAVTVGISAAIGALTVGVTTSIVFNACVLTLTLIATVSPGMALWREKLFVSMSKNATKASEFFQVPTNRVVELGTQVEL
jgi:hypothetical protein